MSVQGKSIVHCHGKDKGKVMHTYKSHAKALEVHRAIMANKGKKRRKISTKGRNIGARVARG